MSDLARRLASSTALLALAATGLAAGEPAAPPRVSATLAASAGYDDNVFLAGSGAHGERASAFAGATVTLAAKPAAGVALGYTLVGTRYQDESTEDNVKQTLSAGWTGKTDAFSWNAATEFAFVDGDDRGVDYGSGVGSAFSTAAPRERRDQWQNKTDLALRRDLGAGFVRAVGKLQYWDMRTARVGAINYVDRHDIQGGADLGRALAKSGPEAYLGYRRGYQFQDNDHAPAVPANASNHYDRYLAGFEGSPLKTLKVNGQLGWEKHAYNADYAGRDTEEGLFVDATLVWSVSPADEVQLKTGRVRTFSTTGKNSVVSTTHQLAWKHVFNPRWSATLAGRVSEIEYAPFRRDDLDYAASASVAWNAAKNLVCTFAVSQDWGRNHLNGLTGAAETAREFDRALVSAAAAWKF